MAGYPAAAAAALDAVWRAKLGLAPGADATALVQGLLPALEAVGADWTLFWRELAGLRAELTPAAPLPGALLARFSARNVFARPTPNALTAVDTWLRAWSAAVAAAANATEAAAAMKLVSPK